MTPAVVCLLDERSVSPAVALLLGAHAAAPVVAFCEPHAHSAYAPSPLPAEACL